MIDSIQLENYRCFEKAKIKFKDISIFVGKNNAGKSSLIEALRLVALAIRKSTKTVYKDLPKEFNIPVRDKGFKLEIDKLKIDLRGIVYLYEDKVAKVTTLLDSGNKIVIYANINYVYACIYDFEGRNISNRSRAKECNIEKVEILPQLGLIKESEKKLTVETIETDKDSYLYSHHFRNEIYLYRDNYWDDFVSLSEKTWEGLKIKEIIYDYSEDDYIKLFISDARFLAEIGLMGSGLQMWLQIMWFLCRTKDSSTIILDEPDVYMHPDLQRKLLRMVKNRYPQTIIATHSVEIITEVEPNNIITIDKKKRYMSYASDLKAVQEIINNIGAVNNLSLTRIGNANKCLFVEGDDLKILAKFSDVIYPDRSDSLSVLPHVSLGGFNNLREAFGASNLFYEETKGTIKCLCVLDRDYFPDNLLIEKQEVAEDNKLDLHIWKRKEIENYILEPTVLFRLTGLNHSNYTLFLKDLENLVNEFKDDVFDQYSEHIAKYRKIEHSTANKEARRFIKANWTTLESKLSLVSGKTFIKRLNLWFRSKYGISCSMNKIISRFTVNEINEEIMEVIEKLI